MVKGVARRVIIVTSPEQDRFEKAFFLLCEDLPAAGDPEEEVLRQAQQAADAYLQRSSPQARRRRMVGPVLFTLLGGVLASAVWWILPVL